MSVSLPPGAGGSTGSSSTPEAQLPVRVLYVDDDRANLVAFRAIAEPHYEVLTARSADEALATLDRVRDIAILITDQRMPGMSGIDLCERARATHPDTVRMLVTAYSDLTAAVSAINRGHVSRYLNKPWNADELLAVLRDAAERYRLSMTVQRLQIRISESERIYALGVLTASIGHELRTPLGIVVTNIEYVRRAIETISSQLEGSGLEDVQAELAEAESALTDAGDGAQRLVEVVDGIGLSARKEPPSRQPVDVAHVLRSVLRLLRGEAQSRARLIVDLGSAPQVVGSPTRIGQVLLNLVLNALQAMPSRPPDSNQVRIALSQRDGKAVLEVSDNGIGIEPTQLKRIFDPFFTTKHKGTGLGLAISRQIVEEMGGKITVESELGVGTRFIVSWPLVS